jgi:hypothetical protein
VGAEAVALIACIHQYTGRDLVMDRTHIALLTLLLCGCGDTRSPERAPEVSPAPGAVLPSDSAADAICRGLTNSYRCAQAIESTVLAGANANVVRDGRVLRIVSERGDTLVLRDSLPDDPDGAWFSYRGLLASVGYHVIEVQYYEGGRYLLVNRRTGWIGSSNGVPVISPDGSRLAAGNVDLEAEYSPTTLQIWSVAADSLVLEFDHDFVASPVSPDSVWGPRSLEWLSSTELRFAREFSLGATGGTARVVRESDRWRILVP